jgi:hypothetical protein
MDKYFGLMMPGPKKVRGTEIAIKARQRESRFALSIGRIKARKVEFLCEQIRQ